MFVLPGMVIEQSMTTPYSKSPQCFVLFLCFNQDGYVRIGVFPDLKELLISLARFCGIAPYLANQTWNIGYPVREIRIFRRHFFAPRAGKEIIHWQKFYCPNNLETSPASPS